ncbi:MAG: GNAT family N-acetyltransferase [Micavibrio aeruginosavorus]|uniref:GNAT family N-acetyltransferase n=1 Tax=Micavibrio aeruginosavorus TaxID=349221 RepID=A0A2W5FMC2_9BACT|nr:MAG: GNAT family N-acetyltransferase [Micavibrio aeruginosavorus]
MTDTVSQVRKAMLSDIPRMQEIRAAVRENILSDPSKVTIDDYRWFIEYGPMWVYEEKGNIEGMSAGDPRDGTIWALFVNPGFEGRGIGRQLFARACQSLKDAGHSEASLYTDANSRAEHFYRAAGWIGQPPNEKGDIVFKTNLHEMKLP